MSRTRTAILAALALVAGTAQAATAVAPGDVGVKAVPCAVD
jgi:cellulose 1,4-beta-cellobiosidase